MLVASVSLPESKYPTQDMRRRSTGDCCRRYGPCQGVTSAGLASMTPMATTPVCPWRRVLAQPNPGKRKPGFVADDFSGTMETLGVKLLRGRIFSEWDQLSRGPW
ncbi:MAG: hypothetical protein QM757_34865 [Paludibaculum sp.]